MAKNYKKIYLKLRKDVEQQVKLYKTYGKPMDRGNFVEQMELEETIHTLEHLLLSMEEFEGKDCHGIHFTNEQFEKWRKQVNAK